MATRAETVALYSASNMYETLVSNGLRKAFRAEHRYLMSTILAGFIVGAYGHCCTLGASKMLSSIDPPRTELGTAGTLYSIYFTGAFQAIIVTGCDLFTSNVLYGLCFLSHWHKGGPWWIKLLMTLKQWAICWVGNLLGCLMAASIFSKCSGHFEEGSIAHWYLCDIAQHKVSHSAGQIIADGIGANFFVGLATVALNTVNDGIGTLFCVMLPVMAFCVGGFQHSIANMYTLMAADITHCEINQQDIWLKNLLPATAGNMLASALICVFLGCAYANSAGPHYWEKALQKELKEDEQDPSSSYDDELEKPKYLRPKSSRRAIYAPSLASQGSIGSMSMLSMQ